jgi:ParB-like chromosome segregation protein Spo0J
VGTLNNPMPPLDAATESALRESIRRFGVLVPVVHDQHGRVLDGHHRSRIADEEKVRYRVDLVTVTDDDEARAIAVTLNADRRQLGTDQRREIVAALRAEGHSLRAIAGAVGVDAKTIRNDIAGGDISPPAEIVGQDGKRYPAKRPTIIAAKNEREAERAQVALSAGAALPEGRTLDVTRAERIAREHHSTQRRIEPVTPHVSEDLTILHGDFAEVLQAEDLTGAVVITDPPYPREFLPLWIELADFTLNYGCEALVTMVGQSILPEALDAISAAVRPPLTSDDEQTRWEYRWCGAYLTPGPAARVWSGKIGAAWKPVLMFDLRDYFALLALQRTFHTCESNR